jgi:hypothetical protein
LSEDYRYGRSAACLIEAGSGQLTKFYYFIQNLIKIILGVIEPNGGVLPLYLNYTTISISIAPLPPIASAAYIKQKFNKGVKGAVKGPF